MGKFVDIILRQIRLILDLIAFVIGELFYPSKKNYLTPITNELLLQPAIELAKRIKCGNLKSETLVRVYIERCKEIEKDLNALVDDNFEEALQEAKNVDFQVEQNLQNGHVFDENELPFLGVPFTAKNSVMAKGKTFSGGVYARRHIKGHADSVVVDRMKKVGGAIFLGLTNIPEMVMWFDSFNRLDGQTNNPYDKSRIPGGSSGGEGALISAAGSVIGIGSDIDGSIRIPSHFCGIFGHKTTPGAVNLNGMYPFFRETRHVLASIGPMCRYACDLRPMLKVLAGDSLQLSEEKLNYSKLRVYYMMQLNDPLAFPVDYEIRQGLKKVIEFFQSKRVKTKEMDTMNEFADFRNASTLWRAAMNDPEHETFLQMATDGKRSEMNPYLELVKSLFGLSKKHTAALLMMGISEELGLFFHGTELYKETLEQLKSKLHKLLSTNGVLLCPTLPEVAFKHNQTLLKFFDNTYTALWNALNVAVTVVPLGLDRRGMPFSVQLIAGLKNDNLSIQVAEELEAHFGGWIPPCSVQIEVIKKQ